MEGSSGNFGRLTRDVLQICAALLEEKPAAKLLAPLILAVPVVTLLNYVVEDLFARRLGKPLGAREGSGEVDPPRAECGLPPGRRAHDASRPHARLHLDARPSPDAAGAPLAAAPLVPSLDDHRHARGRRLALVRSERAGSGRWRPHTVLSRDCGVDGLQRRGHYLSHPEENNGKEAAERAGAALLGHAAAA